MVVERQEQISSLIAQLEAARGSVTQAGKQEALEETLHLVRSLRSIRLYWRWCRQRLPHLRTEAMLELNELLPEWDEPIHQDLLDLEQHRFPGFIAPPEELLTQRILQAGKPMVIVDVGSGAMEIERRVIGRITGRVSAGVTFVGVDASEAAQRWATSNLAKAGCEVIVAGMEQMQNLLAQGAQGIRVILCRGALAELCRLPALSVDVVLHSFLRHHLRPAEQADMDQMIARLSRGVIEYDGYRNWISLICLSATTWRQPAFHAAAVMSYVRFPWKRDLYDRWGAQGVRFFRNGCYVAGS